MYELILNRIEQIIAANPLIKGLHRNNSHPLIQKYSFVIHNENLCRYSSKLSTHHGNI